MGLRMDVSELGGRKVKTTKEFVTIGSLVQGQNG